MCLQSANFAPNKSVADRRILIREISNAH
jgi:hypothetical protein